MFECFKRWFKKEDKVVKAELEQQRLRKELAKEKLEFMRLRNELLKKKLNERNDKAQKTSMDEEEKSK